MRSTHEKPTKSALARTAAYFSMRLPGAKRKAKSKGSNEESHQMVHKQPPRAKTVTPQSGSSPGPSSPLPAKDGPQGECQQTTHFTSETKHTITSLPDSNTLTVESSQTSKLTVLSRPQSRAESNNNSIYSEGSVSQSFPRPPSSNKVTNSEPSSDARTSDVTGEPLPVPAPRNNGSGGGGRVRHTYQNIPMPTKDKSMGVQPLTLQQPPQPYPSVPEVCLVFFFFCVLIYVRRGK